MKLLYFSDISQLDYVIESELNLIRLMQPITGDIAVAFELKQMGINFINEWDFLKPNDIENNWELAHQLSKTHWKMRSEIRHYKGLDLINVSQQDIIYPLWASLNARTVYSEIFQAFAIAELCGFFLPSIGTIRTGPAPTSRAVRSVTEAILLYKAEKQGIKVTRLKSSFKLTNSRNAT
jgi:hypothetical protein